MISQSSLESNIKANLKSCGLKLTQQNECLANAIAKAVIAELKKAEVVVTGGSSAGTYKVS